MEWLNIHACPVPCRAPSPLLSSGRNTKEHGAPNASEQKEPAGRRHKWLAALRQNAAGGGCSDRMLQPPASMAVVASRLSACLPVVPPSMAARCPPINGHLCVSHLTVLVFYSVLWPLGMWMVFYTSDLSTPCYLPP